MTVRIETQPHFCTTRPVCSISINANNHWQSESMCFQFPNKLNINSINGRAGGGERYGIKGGLLDAIHIKCLHMIVSEFRVCAWLNFWLIAWGRGRILKRLSGGGRRWEIYIFISPPLQLGAVAIHCDFIHSLVVSWTSLNSISISCELRPRTKKFLRFFLLKLSRLFMVRTCSRCAAKLSHFFVILKGYNHDTWQKKIDKSFIFWPFNVLINCLIILEKKALIAI